MKKERLMESLIKVETRSAPPEHTKRLAVESDTMPESGDSAGSIAAIEEVSSRSDATELERVRSEIADLDDGININDTTNGTNSSRMSEREQVTIKGKTYTVEYVPKERISPAYGYGGPGGAIVRADLPPRVKRFVRAHELYHCQDEDIFGSAVMKELRATLFPALKDPIGFLATAITTVTDIERLKFYWQRLKRGF